MISWTRLWNNKETTMETMNQGAQDHPEGLPFVMTNAVKQQLRDLGLSNEQIREIPPGEAHSIIREMQKHRENWKRDGLSEQRIAQVTRTFVRASLSAYDDDPGPLDDEEDHPGEEPSISPTMQAAVDAGMQVGAQTILMTTDDGFEEVTIEPDNGEAQAAGGAEEPEAGSTFKAKPPPKRIVPRVGRPAIDINAPEVKRVLERYRPLSLQEIAQQKPPQWLLARHIPENSLVELFGEFATGKSFLALDWALSIAAGKPWLGQKVQQGHVVYVYAEGTQGLRKRGLAWCKENGLDDFPEKFHAIPRPVDMRDPNALDYLVLAIKLALPKGVKPGLIVIDTLNRCFGGGDENSTQDMTGFINGCDALREEFNATVLVVHHSGKDRVKGSRGASALGGAMDVIFELVKARRDQPLGILRNNTNTTKPHKDSAPLLPLALDFVEIELDLEPDADDPHANTSLVVRLSNTEAAVATAAAEQATKRKTVAEETLEIIRRHKNGISRTELIKVTGKARQTINSRLDTLLDAGLIEEEGELFIAVDEDAPG
jgi:hypothetical protein